MYGWWMGGFMVNGGWIDGWVGGLMNGWMGGWWMDGGWIDR